MAGMRVSELDFLRLLPVFMRDDEAVIALSKAANRLMGEPFKRLDTIRTWDQIDNLNDAECDELAWEMDVDWYDSSMTLEEKRATLKVAWPIKRKRGTKWAVEQLISAYFGEGYVMEWYNIYGSPFTFAALTTNPDLTGENFEKFMEAVKAAKNTRSHIAGVFYYWQQGPDPGVEYSLGDKSYRYNFRKCGTYPRRATVGFLIKPSIEVDPEAQLHLYGFTHAGTQKCGTYPRSATLGAALRQGVATDAEDMATRYKFKRKCGTYPRPGTLGQAVREKIEATASALFSPYGFTPAGPGRCGTYPATATLGAADKHPATLAPVEAFTAAYSFVKCGTRRCGE